MVGGQAAPVPHRMNHLPGLLTGADSIVKAPMRSVLRPVLVSLNKPTSSPEPDPEFQVDAKSEDHLVQTGLDRTERPSPSAWR